MGVIPSRTFRNVEAVRCPLSATRQGPSEALQIDACSGIQKQSENDPTPNLQPIVLKAP